MNDTQTAAAAALKRHTPEDLARAVAMFAAEAKEDTDGYRDVIGLFGVAAVFITELQNRGIDDWQEAYAEAMEDTFGRVLKCIRHEHATEEG